MKPGYKKTEIGVIPEDWEVGSLKQAFPRLDAGVSVNSDDSESSDYYILKTSAVRNGNVNIKEAKPVIRSDYARLKCPVKKGSIIISRMNTPAMVGECGFSTIDAPNTFLPDRLWQIEPSSPDYDFQWLNYLLNTEKYSAAIRAAATGTSNSMKNIAKERLLEISIPKPPCPEQERIAEALSDMDELISSLEKLIEKKKAIKQGAMQELLTGKRRLPGFNGEYQECTIEDIADFCTASIPTSCIDILNYIGTDNMLANRGGVRDNTISIPYTAVREYREGDILLSNIRPYLKKIWLADKAGGCSNDVFVIRVKEGRTVSAAFLFYLLSQDAFFDEVMANAIGTKMPRGDRNTIKKYQIRFSCDQNEQLKIVSILSAIDCEIKKLKESLEKVRQIKQGIMQHLLTGKIRLS